MNLGTQTEDNVSDVRIVDSSDWVDVNEFLGNETESLGAVSLADDNVIKNGSEKQIGEEHVYLGDMEQIKGKYLLMGENIVDPIVRSDFAEDLPLTLSPEDRNDAGFYLGNLMGSPTELKIDHQIPDSEQWHLHTGYELYQPINGEIELGLGGKNFTSYSDAVDELDSEYASQQDIYTTRKVSEDQIFAVPPNVPHKVTERYDDPSLLVLRYSGEDDKVDKYWADGTPAYGWTEPNEELSIEGYEQAE